MGFPFEVIQNLDGKWSIVTQLSSHTHTLRSGLTKTHANRLAKKLAALLNTRLTRISCKHCGGIGGCSMCES